MIRDPGLARCWLGGFVTGYVSPARAPFPPRVLARSPRRRSAPDSSRPSCRRCTRAHESFCSLYSGPGLARPSYRPTSQLTHHPLATDALALQGRGISPFLSAGTPSLAPRDQLQGLIFAGQGRAISLVDALRRPRRVLGISSRISARPRVNAWGGFGVGGRWVRAWGRVARAHERTRARGSGPIRHRG